MEFRQSKVNSSKIPYSAEYLLEHSVNTLVLPHVHVLTKLVVRAQRLVF